MKGRLEHHSFATWLVVLHQPDYSEHTVAGFTKRGVRRKARRYVRRYHKRKEIEL